MFSTAATTPSTFMSAHRSKTARVCSRTILSSLRSVRLILCLNIYVFCFGKTQEDNIDPSPLFQKELRRVFYCHIIEFYAAEGRRLYLSLHSFIHYKKFYTRQQTQLSTGRYTRGQCGTITGVAVYNITVKAE